MTNELTSETVRQIAEHSDYPENRMLAAELLAKRQEVDRLSARLADVERQRDASAEALRWAAELIRGMQTETVAEVDGLRIGMNMVASKIAEAQALAAQPPAEKAEGGA